MKFIDIHTHQNNSAKDVLSIRNYILGIDTVQTDSAFSMGIHPWYLKVDTGLLEKLAGDNKNNPNWKALGECGLDFMPDTLKKFDKNVQEKYFLQQIKDAGKYAKPLVIHCVKCFDRLLKIKKKNDNNQIWIVHGFSKNKALAQQLLDAGFYLSFGAHLFKSKTNQEALRYTPMERLFLETDAQTQYDIKAIYQFAAQVKNVSLQEITKQIFYNYSTIL